MGIPKQILSVQRHKLAAWQNHKKAWDGCRRCPLHVHQSKYVFLRGHIPADVLFIGEAPGPVEDAKGYPFLGPAGLLLQQLIQQGDLADCKYAITNTVACLPLLHPEMSGVEVRAPEAAEIKACSPRLADLIKLLQPKAVVYVGKVAASVQNVFKEVPNKVSIPHPAYLLRLESSGSRTDEDAYTLALRKSIYALQSLAMIIDNPF